MLQNALVRMYMVEEIRRTLNIHYVKFLSSRKTYVVVQAFFEKIIVVGRSVIHVVFEESPVLGARRQVKYGSLYRAAFVKRLEIRIMAENTETTASVHPIYELRRVSFRFSAPCVIVIQYSTARLQKFCRHRFLHDYVKIRI